MLEAADLECERGGRTLFRHISFTLGKGELVRIAGRNGSGKTSLLRILCGLLSPAAGEVHWRGESIHSLKEDFSKHIAYLGHAPAVKDDLTAAENLGIACRLAGVQPADGAIDEALRRYGVPQGPFLRKVSQGQRRRAALARLLLSASVPLWLLDEPFTALDVQAAEFTRTVVREHLARGGAAVYTTHQDAGLEETRVIEL